MSGLLERIVRRRRASASSRLGPPAQNGHPSPYDVPYRRGQATELAVTHVNGSPGAAESPEPPTAVEAEAPAPLEVVDVPESVEDPEAVDDRDAVEDPEGAEDESPTMEHRVLVLDQPEPAPPEAKPIPEPAAIPVLAPPPAPGPFAPSVPEPHFRGRARVRRRARYLRQLREIQLRDVGGLALELHRFGRDRPDLLQAKIADAAQTDAELRALQAALGAEEPLRELREAGIGGVCGNCGAVHGSEDHFCASCGEPVGPRSPGSLPPDELDDHLIPG